MNIIEDEITKICLRNIDTWEEISSIPSRITNITNDIVTCNCLIDRINVIYESRTFSSILFKGLKNYINGTYVTIVIKYKIGSMRIDVFECIQPDDKDKI